MGLALLSLILMFADSRFDYLGKVRYYTAVAVTPLHLMADFPVRISEAFGSSFQSRNEMEAENARLEDELMMLQFKLQKLDHLEAENRRLNELLKASSIVNEVTVRAQLLGESPDPFSKRLLINKGSNEGVHIGQPVLDAYGLMGQVVEVEPLTSWVLLITDPLHATPVQVNRNGVRAIAAGTPDRLHQLTLENVETTADVQVGDVLVTSGLDQRLPAGYPVGVVSSIVNDPGKSFATVHVTPTAQLDRSRNVLLLFSSPEPLMPQPTLDSGTGTPATPVVEPAAQPAVDGTTAVPGTVPPGAAAAIAVAETETAVATTLIAPPVNPSVVPADTAAPAATTPASADPAVPPPSPVPADEEGPRYFEGRE